MTIPHPQKYLFNKNKTIFAAVGKLSACFFYCGPPLFLLSSLQVYCSTMPGHKDINNDSLEKEVFLYISLRRVIRLFPNNLMRKSIVYKWETFNSCLSFQERVSQGNGMKKNKTKPKCASPPQLASSVSILIINCFHHRVYILGFQAKPKSGLNAEAQVELNLTYFCK